MVLFLSEQSLKCPLKYPYIWGEDFSSCNIFRGILADVSLHYGPVQNKARHHNRQSKNRHWLPGHYSCICIYTDVWWWNQEGIKKISQLHQHIFSKSGDKLWPDLCRCRRFIFGREHFAKTSKHHHPTPHRLSAQEFQSILTNFLICFKYADFYLL